jgi:hypothetical protein
MNPVQTVGLMQSPDALQGASRQAFHFSSPPNLGTTRLL